MAAGRAKSLAALALGLLGAGAAATSCSRKTTHFASIATESGIAYRYRIDGPRPLNILQTIGNGCALFDFDGDGNLDVLLVGAPCALYRGDGKGRFADITRASGLDTLGKRRFQGVAVGDFDDDDHPDVYLSGWREGALLKNEAGQRLVDVSRARGIRPEPWGTSAAFFPTGPGGALELFVCNYARFGPEPGIPQLCSEKARDGGQIQTSCGPRHYTPIPAARYRRTPSGGFSRQTLSMTTGRGLGIAGIIEDGTWHVALANDEAAGDLLVPEGAGFKNIALSAGVAYDRDANVHGGMGIDWGDIDGDGRLDLFVATYQNEVKCLYKNNGGGSFEESAAALGLSVPSLPWVAFGARFLDFDNDGWLDLAIANGHVQDNAEKAFPTTYRQPAQLFRNLDGKRFEEVPAARSGLPNAIVGRGLASGDIDNDGKLDLLFIDSEGAPVLLRNQSEVKSHWLGFRLLTGKRDALGALVTVTAGGKRLVRHCHSDGSYLSASDPRVHFGLGDATKIDSVEVRWPNGKKTRLASVPIDRYTTVREEDTP